MRRLQRSERPEHQAELRDSKTKEVAEQTHVYAARPLHPTLPLGDHVGVHANASFVLRPSKPRHSLSKLLLCQTPRFTQPPKPSRLGRFHGYQHPSDDPPSRERIRPD